MKSNIRFDTFKIPKVSKTKEGFVRGEVVASRAGIFEYLNMDGTIRRELRHPDDVFKPESLASIKMIPVTDNHPHEFVDSSNAHKYQVGFTGEKYEILDNKIITSITVTHQDAIEKIQNGKLELSLGYSVDLIAEKGTYDGESYDYRQLNPVYNHLAIVERGRAGHDARFRFDNAAELLSEFNINDKKEEYMSDKAEVKTDDRLDSIIAEKVARIDALSSEIELLKTKNSNLEQKLDAMTTLANTKEKELVKEKELKADSLINKLAEERVIVFARALPFLKNDAFSFVHHTNREIMEAAINSMRKDSADFTGKSDEYVSGVFETFVATNAPQNSGNRDQADQIFGVLAKNCDMAASGTMHDDLMKQLQDRKVK